MLTDMPSRQLVERMTGLRREFHRHPELSFQEEATAARIMKRLEELGLDPEYGGKGGGVMARLGSGKPLVALRAEMDALPVEEMTELPFRSVERDRMHACGHDAHMAMLLGAAEMLVEDPPPGQVLFLFQPAEEMGGGARTMIDAGAMKDVDAVFAGHVTQQYPTGQIMVTDGIVTAQSDRFDIHVTGRGGHGARPYESIDAVIVAGLLISVIQTLITRELNPFFPTVVTIGKVVAGTAANAIAEEAKLEGTIRTTDPNVRKHVCEGLKRMGESAAELHRARVDVDITSGYPPVINTTREAMLASRAASAIVGEAGMATMEHPSMGAEDFAYYLKEVPGCYVRFGARRADSQPIALHSPSFDIDEGVLPVGAAFYNQLAREAIEEYSKSSRQ